MWGKEGSVCRWRGSDGALSCKRCENVGYFRKMKRAHQPVERCVCDKGVLRKVSVIVLREQL